MSLKRNALAAVGSIGAMLWVYGAAADDAPPGAKPGDEAMTCQQIAAEFAPYAQKMMPSVTALSDTGMEIIARGNQRIAEETPATLALTIAATLSSADPTGISSAVVSRAEILHQQEVWQRALAEDKPLSDKQQAQTEEVMTQAQQLQSDVRLQRLMQLVQEKHCDGK